jgi:small-conductance mechanosensitive channel
MAHLRTPTTPTRAAGWLRGAILVLALALMPAIQSSGQAPAPQAEAAAPEKPEKPKPQPISIADVGVRAEQAKGKLAEMEKGLELSDAVSAVESGLPDLGERVQRQLAKSDEILSGSPSIRVIDELKQSWISLGDEIKKKQAVLSDRGTRLERQIEAVRETDLAWKATRDAVAAANATQEVLAQIAEVEAVIERVLKTARERQGAVVTLQSRVAQLNQTVSGDLKRLDDARQNAVGEIFRADSAPVWSPETYQPLSEGEVFARVAEAQRRDFETIRTFGRERAEAIALHGVLLVATAVFMFVARRRVRVRAATDEGLAGVAVVFERPISLAVLLVFLLSIWTLPQPRPVSEFVALALLVPAVLILRSLLDRPVFPLLNALVVFWMVDRTRGMLGPLPHAPRLLFMLEMLGLIALLLWWLRPKRLIDIPSEVARSQFFRVLGVGVRVALVGAVVALCAAAMGYDALGRLIGNSLLLGAYAGVILYGAVRVLDGIVAFLLRVRPLRLLGMVRQHRWLIRMRTMRVVRIGATVWWLSVVLRRMEIADDVWAGIVAVFGASIGFGEFNIAVGDLVVFVITIWVTFKLSRFIRFLLEEDVYTRVPLRKGVPYAVSTLTHYTILVVGFTLAVLALGVDLNRFALLAGAFGVGIGFGLQSIVNNFVSGLILLTERPVEVGDTISLTDLFGEVKRIGIRSSTVRTWQGADVIVPNGDLVSAQVINWTHSDQRRRLEIPVGVAYGTTPKRVIEVLLEVMNADSDLLTDPEPYVLFTGFGESSLDFEARAWTDKFDAFLRVRSKLCVDIEAALGVAGITIPFPQRDLHIRSVTAGETSESAVAKSKPTKTSQSEVPAADSPPDGDAGGDDK